MSADTDIMDYMVVDSIVNGEENKKETNSHIHQGKLRLSDNYIVDKKLLKGKDLMSPNKPYKDMNGKHFQNLEYDSYYLINIRAVVFEWSTCKCQYSDERVKLVRKATKEDLDPFKNNKKWYQTYNAIIERYELSIWVIVAIVLSGITIIAIAIGLAWDYL